MTKPIVTESLKRRMARKGWAFLEAEARWVKSEQKPDVHRPPMPPVAPPVPYDEGQVTRQLRSEFYKKLPDEMIMDVAASVRGRIEKIASEHRAI